MQYLNYINFQVYFYVSQDHKTSHKRNFFTWKLNK